MTTKCMTCNNLTEVECSDVSKQCKLVETAKQCFLSGEADQLLLKQKTTVGTGKDKRIEEIRLGILCGCDPTGIITTRSKAEVTCEECLNLMDKE